MFGGVAKKFPATMLLGASMLAILIATGVVQERASSAYGEAYPAAPGGVCAGIHIQTLVNGHDANTPPGSMIRVGTEITWTYVVTNAGCVPLADVIVSDDQGVIVDCASSSLEAGESLACTAAGVFQPGQYGNIGSVTATAPDLGSLVVQASDPSHYFGANPSIEIQTQALGQDADDLPGPMVLANTLIDWTYLLSNTGNVTLENIAVIDDHARSITCSAVTLSPDESTVCFATDTAQAGQMSTFGVAVAVAVGDLMAVDFDSAYAFGAAPSITIQKSTSSLDADYSPGVYVVAGSAVQWTYEVINTGNVDLSEVAVSDEQGGQNIYAGGLLQPGESALCFAAAIAEPGQQGGIATATAVVPGLAQVSGTDPSHYFGATLGIDIEMLIEGEDADASPGPSVLVGQPVRRLYHVMNTSNLTITGITVSDLDGTAVNCPGTTLAASGSMECEAEANAQPDQHRSDALVVGSSPGGLPSVIDLDPGHYFGAAPAITLDLLTNGHDADDTPGPTLLTGAALTKTYLVRNIGNVALASVAVTDSDIGQVTCPLGDLDPAELMICVATGTVEGGQHFSLATVGALFSGTVLVTAGDSTYYFGQAACIFDCDGDGDVDLEDFVSFQNAFDGPG